MDNGYSQHDVISILRFLDTFIEIETNSTGVYRELAHSAKQDGPRALFGWLYNLESSRLRKLLERRRKVLIEYPEVVESKFYMPREGTGLTKMGPASERLQIGGCLEIFRYALENELRAKQFFHRKASLSNQPMQRMLYSAAAIEHQDHADYLGGQREALLQQQVNSGVKRMAEAVA